MTVISLCTPVVGPGLLPLSVLHNNQQPAANCHIGWAPSGDICYSPVVTSVLSIEGNGFSIIQTANRCFDLHPNKHYLVVLMDILPEKVLEMGTFLDCWVIQKPTHKGMIANGILQADE